MSLLDKIKLAGKYEIKVGCKNCGMPNYLKVKKGTSVYDFASNKLAKCENCGCTIKFKEYQTEWLN